MRPAAIGLPHARQLACVERIVEWPKKNKLTRERSWYVTSHDQQALRDKAFLSKIRNHWSIENKSHYIRDRYFDEDRCMIRGHNAARILSSCRQLVIAQKYSQNKRSTAQLCDFFMLNIHRAIKLIT